MRYKIPLLLLTILFIIPLTVFAFGGDTGTGSSADCCGGSDTSTPAPTPSPRPSPDPEPDRPDRPSASCTLSATETTINSGESTELTVISDATAARLYKIDGWKYILGIFKTKKLVFIGEIPIGSAYTITPDKSMTYQVLVRKRGYSAGLCRIKINVIDSPTPPPATTPSCTISANPNSVTSSDSTVLSWTSNNATEASIDNSIGTVGTVGSYSIGNITSNTTYTMTVSNTSGNTATCSTSVSVINPPTHQYPSCNVWVSPSSVEYGGQTTLYWTSSNATSMLIPSIGTITPNSSGSRTFYNLIDDRVFECRAYDDDGHLGTDSTQVTVEQYSYTPPTCSLFASPINITTGGDSTLSWNTTNATSVTLSGMGSVPLNGTKILYNLQNSTTYTLRASGPNGTATCTRTVNVSEPYQPPVVPPSKVRPTCQIYPIYINRDITSTGGGAILTWTAQNATLATLTDHGTVNRVTGTQFVKPTESKTYTLTVYNDGYRASCSTLITVNNRIITDYTPTGSVSLTGVPYTGAEDYISVILLLLTLLTLSFVIFFYRHHIWKVVAPKR